MGGGWLVGTWHYLWLPMGKENPVGGWLAQALVYWCYEGLFEGLNILYSLPNNK